VVDLLSEVIPEHGKPLRLVSSVWKVL
jgi:hypothetical protein